MNELQKIYDSEINISITTFWDAGYKLKLGDEANGYNAEGNVDTAEEIVPWFQKQIKLHYPKSKYVYELDKPFKKSVCCDFVTGLRKGKTICLRCEKIVLTNPTPTK